MSTEPGAATASTDTPRYARLSRRMRAYLIDLILIFAVMVASLFAASAAESDGFSRTLGFTVVITLLAYEPLLVSFTGGSVGPMSPICASSTTAVAATSASGRRSLAW